MNYNKKGVYLVQPACLIDTNRYKFGMSSNIDKRVKDYGKDTIIIFKFYSFIEPNIIEELLKIIFDKYIYTKNEYIIFDDLQILKNMFIDLIFNCNIIYKDIHNVKNNILFNDKYKIKSYDIIDNNMKNNIYNSLIDIYMESNKTILIKNPSIKQINNNIIYVNSIINDNTIINDNKNLVYDNKNYTCIRCNKNFGKFKTHLMNHFKRKNICYPINRDINNDELIVKLELDEYFDFCNHLKSQFKCPFCDSYYNHKNSVSRHKKNCIFNPINIHISKYY
jgi:hypothetical protein